MRKVNMAISRMLNAGRSFGEMLQSLMKQKRMLEQVNIMQKLQSGGKSVMTQIMRLTKYKMIDEHGNGLIACGKENIYKKFKTSREGAM